MISSYDTNKRRIFEDHLENAQQNLQSKSLIVEQIAEKNNSRLRSAMLVVVTDQQQSGFKSEQVAVQVADKPERVFISYLSDVNCFITMKGSIRVEQHPGARGLVEQVLHPRNNRRHATPHAPGVDAVTKRESNRGPRHQRRAGTGGGGWAGGSVGKCASDSRTAAAALPSPALFPLLAENALCWTASWSPKLRRRKLSLESHLGPIISIQLL